MTDYSSEIFIKLALTYLLLVFLGSLGVIQAAAAFNGLSGLLFWPGKMRSYLLAAALAGPPLALFFTWNDRWATGVIQGVEQSVLFIIGIAAALMSTLILTSLLRGRRTSIPVGNTGLPALRKATWLQAMRRHFHRQDDDPG